MKSPPNLSNVQGMSPAEKRAALDRQNRLDFIAYKRAQGETCAELAQRFDCSADSIERYLTGGSPVPGYIVSAIRGGKVAA